IHRDGTPMKCTETEVIIDGHRQVEVTFDHLERNHLVLGNNLSADVIQDLSQMFPCVSSLQLAIHNLDTSIIAEFVVPLLMKWDHCLATLKVFNKYTETNRKILYADIRPLVKSPSKLPKLRHLTMNFTGHFFNHIGELELANL